MRIKKWTRSYTVTVKCDRPFASRTVAILMEESIRKHRRSIELPRKALVEVRAKYASRK